MPDTPNSTRRRGESRSRSRPLIVLEATNPPDGTTRYIDQVVTYAPDDVEFEYLSPWQMVRGGFDVIHFHWPEVLVRSRSSIISMVRCVFLLVAVLLLNLRRVAIVRTLHNTEPHEAGTWLERWTLARLDRATDHWVRINDVTEVASGTSTYIPHGHYRDRFASYEHHDRVPGRLAYAGLVRPYKGVERLITCFGQIDDPDLSLRIVGRATDDLATVVESAAAADRRITTWLEFVPDADLVSEITQSELVCLPYDELHNSGMLLVALSLNRPVLVPASATTTALAAEVGEGWIYQFEGQLTSEVLSNAVVAVAGAGRSDHPRLEGRDWQKVADGYANVFRQAASSKGRWPHA